MYKRKGRKADLPRFMTVGTTFLVIKNPMIYQWKRPWWAEFFSLYLSMKKAVMSGFSSLHVSMKRPWSNHRYELGFALSLFRLEKKNSDKSVKGNFLLSPSESRKRKRKKIGKSQFALSLFFRLWILYQCLHILACETISFKVGFVNSVLRQGRNCSISCFVSSDRPWKIGKFQFAISLFLFTEYRYYFQVSKFLHVRQLYISGKKMLISKKIGSQARP